MNRKNIFKKIFSKPANIGLTAHFKMLFLEIYIGEQLLEMIGNTSSCREREHGAVLGEVP